MQKLTPSRWITTKAASEITGYNVEYVRQLARNGSVAAKRVSTKILIDKNTLAKHQQAKGTSNARRHIAALSTDRMASETLARSNARYLNDPAEREKRHRIIIEQLLGFPHGHTLNNMTMTPAESDAPADEPLAVRPVSFPDYVLPGDFE